MPKINMIVTKKWIIENVVRIRAKNGLKNIKKNILKIIKTGYIFLPEKSKKKIELGQYWRPFKLQLKKNYAVYCIAYYRYHRRRWDRPNYELRKI